MINLQQVPYWYSVDLFFADAAAIGTQVSNALRVNDVHFVCTAILVTSRIDDTGVRFGGTDDVGTNKTGSQPDSAYLINIKDGTMSRNHMDVPIDAGILGGAGVPRTLPVPLLMRKGSTFTCTVTNLKQTAAGVGQDCRVIFEGYNDFGLTLAGD